MNRQRRRRAKTENEAYKLRQLGIELYAGALAKQEVVCRIHEGWSVGLYRKVCEHGQLWHLVGVAAPPGRPITEPDCAALTKIVGAVRLATGYPDDGPPVQPVVPSAGLAENGQSWFWADSQLCECLKKYLTDNY